MSVEKMSESAVINMLNSCYRSALDGVAGTSSARAFADEYLAKENGNVMAAAKRLISMQKTLCAGTGFLTGVGGLITAAVAVPADVAGTVFMQLRMICALAYMGGYDPEDENVRALAYACLAGVPVDSYISGTDISAIPMDVAREINREAVFRLMAKTGTRGAAALFRMAPVIGGAIGAVLDLSIAGNVADNSVKVFLRNK